MLPCPAGSQWEPLPPTEFGVQMFSSLDLDNRETTCSCSSSCFPGLTQRADSVILVLERKEKGAVSQIAWEQLCLFYIDHHPASHPPWERNHRGVVGSVQALISSRDAPSYQILLQCLSSALQQCLQSWSPMKVVGGSAKTIF